MGVVKTQFAFEALKSIFKKPSTEEYPHKRREPPKDFRGRPVWLIEKCVGCGLCARVCPVKAIKIIGRGKEVNVTYLLDRCIFCAQCAESCNIRAIAIVGEFEFAGYDKSKMSYIYDKKQLVEKEAEIAR
ncbi:MAG: 4Fe-4S binding protein [Nitrososphaerota archaeon]